MTPCSDGLIRTYAGVVWRLVRTCRIPLLTSLPGPVPSGSESGAHKYLYEPRRSTQTKEERGAMHAAAAAVETAVGSQRVRPCAKMFHVKHDRHNTQAELRQGLPKWSHPGSNRLVPDLMELPWASGIGHGAPDQGTRPRNLDPEPRKGPFWPANEAHACGRTVKCPRGICHRNNPCNHREICCRHGTCRGAIDHVTTSPTLHMTLRTAAWFGHCFT